MSDLIKDAEKMYAELKSTDPFNDYESRIQKTIRDLLGELKRLKRVEEAAKMMKAEARILLLAISEGSIGKQAERMLEEILMLEEALNDK